MNVLIFGLGLNEGGVGSAKFFAQKGDQVKVTDLKTKKVLQSSLEQLKDFSNISYTLGEHKYEDIDWADLIIKNPAVKRENKFLEYASTKKKKVETDLGIFFQLVNKSQIIGVTGSKGKSTTASLIYEGLKAVGKEVVLAGNIGKSVLDCIPFIKQDTLIILEISSFQLEGLISHKVSPKYAVITNIHPDHLNYYKSIYEYIEAKRLIAQFQNKSDFLFLNKDDQTLHNTKFLTGLSTNLIHYSKDNLPKDFKPYLSGNHNLENVAAALSVTTKLKVSQDKALAAMKKFKGVPFRMELIKQWDGFKIYNDTTATNPTATIEALKTLHSHITRGLIAQGSGKLNIILICGGMNKGMDYTQLASSIKKFVKKIFFLEGDAAKEIQKLLSDTSNPYNDLEKLLTDVKKEIKPGDIILFSPAATSFNLFQNEFDRGRKFNKAVEKIFKYCTLYIVRHGQTDWNAQGTIQGETDIPLNSIGIKQAQTLGKTLKKIEFDAVFSSDLIRAKRTAEIITLERRMAIETTHLLRERRYGKFDGKPWQLMQKFYDTWETLSKKERVGYRPYQGYETDEEAVSRFITFLREVAAFHSGKTILVVSHGGLMRAFLNHISEVTYFTGSVSNSAYIRLESDGVDFFIKELKGIKNSN